MLSRVRASTLVGLAALAFWAIALPSTAHDYFGGDLRAFLRLGTAFQHPAELSGAPLFPGDGYDGQFFAALATDPLLLRADTPLMFDAPVYRAGRIGLPLLAWLLAGGDGRMAILIYQLLAWSVGLLVVWVVARWLEDEGHSPWWAALLVLSGGTVSCVLGSMPDLAAIALVAAALWRDARGDRRATLALLVAATLVRETSLIAAAAIALRHLRARDLKAAVTVVLLPGVVLAAWRIYVLLRLGDQGLDVPGGNLDIPLTWLPEKLAQRLDAPEYLGLAGFALSILAFLALLPQATRFTPLETTFAAFAVLSLFLSRLNYVVIWWGYTRSLLGLCVLAIVIAGRAGPGWRRWLYLSAPVAFAGVGVLMLYRWAAGLALVLAALWALRRFGRRAPQGAAS